MSRGHVAIAVFLAVLPLLPAGPGYLGVDAPNIVDAAVVVLVTIWLAVRAAARRSEIRRATFATAVQRAWLVLMVAASGAWLVAFAAEMRPGSAVFVEQMAGFPRRILQPLDFAWDPFYPARMWLTFFEGFVVFAIIRDCCAHAESPRHFVRTAIWGWLSGLGIVSTLAVLQYVTRFQLHPFWVARNPGLVRAHATLDDPNALASYLLLGIGLAIGVALSERRRAAAIVAAGISVIASLAVLTTASRAALIALPLSALFVAAFGPVPDVVPARFRRIARGTLGAVGAVAIVLLAARWLISDRLAPLPTSSAEAIVQTLDPRTPTDQVFRERFVYWDAAVRMAQQHPIGGIGLGRYPREAPRFQSRWMPVENTHNFFLQLLAEAGLVGLLAFAALWVIVIATLWRAAGAGDRAGSGLAWGALIGMVAFGLTLLTGHSLVAPSGQVLWGSAVALALIGSTRPSPPDTGARTLAVGAAIFVVCVYAASAWRTPSPPRLTDAWGYSWGFYPQEAGFVPAAWNLPVPDSDLAPAPAGTSAAVFRWSGARAVLETLAPPGATEYVLPFAAFPARVTGVQTVRFSYGNIQETVDVRTSDLQTVRIPLTPEVLDGRRRLLVRIDVIPAFVPAKLGMSADTRALGIQLFPARFQ